MNLSSCSKGRFCLVADGVGEIAVGTIEEIAEELFSIYPDLALKLEHCNQSTDHIDCLDISSSYAEKLVDAVKELCLSDGNEVLSELRAE